MNSQSRKELVLLVGPQGSGKSTLAQKEFSDYTRISQDEMGKTGHFDKFLKALSNNEDIVLDRINHTIKQRKKYLELAKKKEYRTRIITLNEPFEVCYNRILNRKNHPTLKSDDEFKVLKALRLYFREYEIPHNFECDVIENKTDYDPYMLNLSSKFENFLVFGDIHGCFDEFKELYDKVVLENKVDFEKTALVFVGDLIDKGPKVKEIWEFFENHKNAFTVLGNHEFKLMRYLRGHNIIINHGLDVTIKQLGLEDINCSYAQKLLFELESVPYVIKLSEDDFIIHAGLNTHNSIYSQNRQNLLYTRTFNPVTLDFTNNEDKPWFEFYQNKSKNIYFGHHFYDKIEVKKNVFSMDGYCVYGKELRAVFLDKNSKGEFNRKFYTQKAKEEYYINKIPPKPSSTSPFEFLVKTGYLKKQEKGDLVLYNYSDKCVYEQKWDILTMRARGLVFDKKAQKAVARPFPKFFNLNENKLTQLSNLPINEKFEVFDKVDGSLGILFFYNDSWQIITRGNFVSEQALRAKEMLKNYDLSGLDKEFTFMVEIIYPENKIIVDYGDEEKLVLLGAINTFSHKEMNFDELKEISENSGLELVKKFDYSIDDLLNLKTSMSKDIEGFVIRFENGLRVKVKGDEYLKLARILSNISPLSFWKAMNFGRVNEEYIAQIPEEFIDDVEKIVDELEKNYLKVQEEIQKELNLIPFEVNQDNLEEKRKELGIFIKENRDKFKHSRIFFPLILEKREKVDEYILKAIRPKGEN